MKELNVICVICLWVYLLEFSFNCVCSFVIDIEFGYSGVMVYGLVWWDSIWCSVLVEDFLKLYISVVLILLVSSLM